MARRSLDGSRAIVTGVSSGIGRALVLQLLGQKGRVLGIARRQEKLDELATEAASLPGELQTLAGDVTEASLRTEALATRSTWGGLDLLVNNAGIGGYGPFAQADDERLRRIMEVNFFAPAAFIRQAIPTLRDGRAPMVVNIGSVLGHRGTPGNSEICASKFAIRGLSESLRPELQREGIDLLLVSPSTTQTEFFDRVIEGKDQPRVRGKAMPAQVAARQIAKAIRRGQHEIVLSLGGKLLVLGSRLFPRLMDSLVARFSK